MTRTVEVVVAGVGLDTFAAASAALRRGHRVLVLLRTGDPRVTRRLRRRLRQVAREHGGTCAVESHVDVVCVDGVGGVEAVVFRHRRTGRLDAVNAAAMERLPAPASTRPPRSATAPRRRPPRSCS